MPQRDHPKYAILYGRKVRVVTYEGDGFWIVIDSNDMYRYVNGKALTFLPEKRST